MRTPHNSPRPPAPGPRPSLIRIVLPFHLRNLARVDDEVTVEVAEPISIEAVLNALEENFPMLRGTIRDHGTRKRRAFLRFFAGGNDLSNDAPDTLLPEDVSSGKEPLFIIGAIAGG